MARELPLVGAALVLLIGTPHTNRLHTVTTPYREGPSFGFPTVGPALKRLLIALAVIFVLDLPFGGGLQRTFGFSLEGMLDAFGLGSLRAFTYMWVHSYGSPSHLLFNLLFLYFFGTMVEQRVGYLGMFKMFVAGGLAGGVLYAALSPLSGTSGVPVVGASGAATACIVYAATWQPHSPVMLFFVLRMPLWLVATLIVGLDFYMAWFQIQNGIPDQVARTAHLGGAALGFVACRRNWFIDHTPYAYSKGVLGGVKEWLAKRKAQRDQVVRARNEKEMDRILAKIGKEGMNSLSSEERKFMERMSKGAGRK